MKKIVLLASALLLLSTAVFVRFIKPVEAGGTIYIRADGSVDPPTAPIQRVGDIYTFIGNISESIVVQKDHIIVDGKGFTLQGTGTDYAIDISNRINVTIKNAAISDFFYGIFLRNASRNTIEKNTVARIEWGDVGIYCWDSNNNTIVANNIKYWSGIYLRSSDTNTVIGNNIKDNLSGAIAIGDSSNNLIIGNNMTNNSHGISLWGSSSGNLILRNYVAENVDWGVSVGDCVGSNNLTANTIINNGEVGIRVWESSNTVFKANLITDHQHAFDAVGIFLYRSSNNMFVENNLTNNKYPIRVEGFTMTEFINNVDTSNEVDGKPIYYLVNQQDANINPSILPNIGYLALINSTNITVEDIKISNNEEAVLLAFTKNCIVKNVSSSKNRYGLHLYKSSNNTIIGNNITNNYEGIYLENSSNNTISNNILTLMPSRAIYFSHSHYNTLSANNITNAGGGIHLILSDYNFIVGNTVSNIKYEGILLHSHWNLVHCNNFIENRIQAVGYVGPYNFWDNGYPSGGNYWSDYTSTDFYSGPYQNETGSDGIGDTPYVIDENNQDNYPLIHPYGSIRNLDTNLTYLTIQSAIDANETLDGHTILVDAGTYYENVTVNKNKLTLIGENKNSTIIDGNGTGSVISVTRSNVTITGFTIRNGSVGIKLHVPGLGQCRNITISNNLITDMTGCGIWVFASDNNRIVRNTILNSWVGINLGPSHSNTVRGNIISNNKRKGIASGLILIPIYSGLNSVANDPNKILENLIVNNKCGINITNRSGEIILHNNFVNNTVQAYVLQQYGIKVTNIWDNGFEGNYWSDYNGTDAYYGENATGPPPDGIGDTPYTIDANNADRYPLMGMFSDFNATSEHHVQTICNSTISDFQFNGTAVSFNVSGKDGTAGFCRILIPTGLMNDTYNVFVNGTEISYTLLPCSNSTHSYLYFTYNHSTQEVIVITEFPTWTSILLILIVPTVATAIYKRRLLKSQL